jgi:hypothetical protein
MIGGRRFLIEDIGTIARDAIFVESHSQSLAVN